MNRTTDTEQQDGDENPEGAPAAAEPTGRDGWIARPQAGELNRAIIERFPLLRRAPTYKDDQGVLDASADVVELPDGSFRMREL